MSGKSGEPDPIKQKNKKIFEASLGSLSESISSTDPSIISQLENNKNILDPKVIEDSSSSKSDSIISLDSDHSVVSSHKIDENFKVDNVEDPENLSAVQDVFLEEEEENSLLSIINNIQANKINSSSKGNSKKLTGKKRRLDSNLSNDKDDFN